ncbi:M3 family metallopeptidase [Aquisalinus flavus]|uniref:Zn-dependent oligopeptidase n=1 Tax=Aquisalinus flavus TaxID=1526572 RepID=A0A8J2Y7K4_9PROT|nr:M3 family metallopeptidase [Aquisalinus flavus]MBD0425473.1 Zn-dependent oligopeptidase [Aquisalinus flavus]GGD15781.1 Zn-dependent oligopeptidase [Aquisalinus flavus]
MTIKSFLLGAAAAAAVVAPALTPALADEDVDAFISALAIAPESPEALTQRCDAAVEKIGQMKTALEDSTDAPGLGTTLAGFDELYLMTVSAFLEGYLLSETHPDADMRDAGAMCLQKTYNFYSGLSLSRPIYEQLSAIDLTDASEEQRYLVEKQLTQFRKGGVTLDEEGRAAVEALQNELNDLSLKHSQNIRDEDAVVKALPDQLAGLPQDYIDNHPVGEDGAVTITMAYPDVSPVFTYAEDESLRREVSRVFANRAWPEQTEVFRAMLEKRYELAQLLGYDTYAHFDLDGRMIETPERAREFIDSLSAVARPASVKYHDRLLARLQQDEPEAEQVPGWSASYYGELVRQEDYALDSQEVRQYFAFDNVQEGMFTLIEDLFGVEITPWATETWHDSVNAYEMHDSDGTLIGKFYLDLHPREGKFSHAAMFPLRVGLTDRSVPVGTLVTNFPAGDHSTGLMEHGQVETFLHEFGHLIHWLFSGNLDYAMQNFSEIESDFTEAPSTMLEEWVWDYDNLKQFAVNAEGEVLPKELFDKMVAARLFGQGSGVMSQLAYSDISLSYYDQSPEGMDLDAVFSDTFATYSPFEQMEGTHNWASFGHLDGYGAAYYTYQWSTAIALDIFSAFEANGLRDPETAARYRTLVLAPGGKASANDLLEDFLGREFSVEAYEKRLMEEE